MIRWEEPPEHGNKRAAKLKYQDLADALRAEPKRWAVVAEGITTGTAGGMASRIRRGQGPFGPAGSFEARVIGPPGGQGVLYARYVGKARP